MGVPSLNDLAVDGTLNTTNHNQMYFYAIKQFKIGFFTQNMNFAF